MPRSETATKDSRLEIRLTAEDKNRLATAAETNGRSLSNWIRFVLLRAAGEKKPAKKRR